jgi:tetratricopeptide (TPR) repeat protein
VPQKNRAAGALIVGATLAAYAGTFSVPFLFDDRSNIADNPSLRHWSTAFLSPPGGSTVGRPFFNFTLAISYLVGGLDVRGYHFFNLALHALSALTLFGILRRTLQTEALQKRFGADATPLALAASLLWALHPLQTEAVTYISERSELLAGLFYLLTLYAFIRARVSSAPFGWLLASGAACYLGSLSKEIALTVPVLVLLYDRTFFSGTFSEAWRKNRLYYAGLLGSWALFVVLYIVQPTRGVGPTESSPWTSYALTSCRSIALYLKLAFWPHPLVFDYGPEILRQTLAAVPYALLVAGLLAGTVWAVRRRSALGFAAAWFFVVLAPTSSVVPIQSQPTAESRMYLPLAAVAAVAAFALYAWAGRRGLALLGLAAIVFGGLTFNRNKLYRSELSLWSDTVEKRPENERAHEWLGETLAKIPGRLPEALAQYEEALRLAPGDSRAHDSLGLALSKIPGRLSDAVSE